MSMHIHIEKVTESKADNIDFDNVPLGRSFTDHMFISDFNEDKWENPRIVPIYNIPIHPAAMALHYGQAIFEGMKATVDQEGTPMLFRPELNAKRLNYSAARMGMPAFPEELFLAGLKQLVALDQKFIPPTEGSALYLRPFMYADEAFIGMRAATKYKFIIIASPSNPLYSKRIKLWAETNFIRAAHGGTGEAKAAGNYAAAIRPTELAKEKGYDQVLWLDANEHKYIQEVGTMNIFFKIDGEFITPQLDGAILNGITRLSMIDYLRHLDYKVTERPITIHEIIEASNQGKLEEAFGTGTAVGIAMIHEIGYKSSVIHVSDQNEVGQQVLDYVNEVRAGKTEDQLNWMVKIQK